MAIIIIKIERCSIRTTTTTRATQQVLHASSGDIEPFRLALTGNLRSLSSCHQQDRFTATLSPAPSPSASLAQALAKLRSRIARGINIAINGFVGLYQLRWLAFCILFSPYSVLSIRYSVFCILCSAFDICHIYSKWHPHRHWHLLLLQLQSNCILLLGQQLTA